MKALAAALLALLLALAVPRPALAEEPEAFARIVVDSAELRSGPGVSYRGIYNAQRGDTLAIDGRRSKPAPAQAYPRSASQGGRR